MKIKFWGTRGSLPAPLTAEQVRAKVLHALMEARGSALPVEDTALAAWMDEHLPFHLRATCGGNTSCVQVLAGEGSVVLDGGTGLRDFAHHTRKMHTMGTRTPYALGATYHLVLSHLHWDHVQGLPFFYPFYLPGQKVVIYGVHEEIEAAVRQQFSAPSFPVPYEALRAEISYVHLTPGEPRVIAGMTVTGCEQNHPGRSYGYRFEHGGQVFVYSTDCEHKSAAAADPDYPLLKFFADADLLVFDAMYSLEEATYAKADWGHSSNIMAVELAARARAKRLALFHHDPHHDDAEMEEVLFSTRMYAELFHQEKGRQLNGPNKFPTEVLLAYDGLEVEL